MNVQRRTTLAVTSLEDRALAASMWGGLGTPATPVFQPVATPVIVYTLPASPVPGFSSTAVGTLTLAGSQPSFSVAGGLLSVSIADSNHI